MSRDLRVCLLFIHALITTLVFILGLRGRVVWGKELRGKGKLDGGYAGTLLNEKLGGGDGSEINGTWLTSHWCTSGEKFALFVYDREKMREKEGRPGSFISMFREPRYHVYTRVLVTRKRHTRNIYHETTIKCWRRGFEINETRRTLTRYFSLVFFFLSSDIISCYIMWVSFFRAKFLWRNTRCFILLYGSFTIARFP